MNTAVRSILAALFLLGPSTWVNAWCGYPSYYYPVTYYPPYVEKVIEKKVVVLEYVPVFAVGYAAQGQAYVSQPQPAAAPAPTCEEKLKVLEQKLSSIESKMNQPAQPVPQSTFSPTNNSVILSACASCHDKTTAQAHGKGFVLSEGGKVLGQDVNGIGKVMKEISSGRMPKKSKLSDSDFNRLMTELVELSAK